MTTKSNYAILKQKGLHARDKKRRISGRESRYLCVFFSFLRFFEKNFTNFEELSKIYKYNYMSELKKKNYANGLIRKKQIYFGKGKNYEKTFN